jgi:hypothetical protein
MEIKQCSLQHPMVQWRNQKENLIISWNKWKYKPNIPKPIGYSKSNTNWEAYRNKCLWQNKNISNKQSNNAILESRKQILRSQIRRRKDQSRNKWRPKKKYKQINETKSLFEKINKLTNL